MFCNQCGSQLVEGASFCQKCGAKVSSEDMGRAISVPSYFAQEQEDGVIPEKPHDSSAVMEDDPEMEKKTDHVAQQASADRTFPDTNKYGNNIKPYYREQFDRIAQGQKAKFNWAAFFLNGWIQLYNGCSKVFCKTFLPWLLIYFIVTLIGNISVMKFNFKLIGITSVLGTLLSMGGIALCIVNGIKFNEWFYQDVINNPGKKRSKKGVWILIAAEIIAAGILFFVPRMFAPSYDGLIGDGPVDDGLTDDELIDDLDYELSEESENITAEMYPESAQPVTADEALRMIEHWLIDHPVYPDFPSNLSPSIDEEAYDDDGNDSWEFELWVDGEEYARIFVNKDDGDIIIEYLIWNEHDRTLTSDQMPIDQWYTNVYIDESAVSAVEAYIMELVGTFGCDMSFEAEGQFVNFYYMLEIDWDDPYIIITETWRGNTVLEGIAGVDGLAGNTLIFYMMTEDGTDYETHYLTYIRAEDSPLGEDLIYIDGDETMPYIRE